MTVALIATIQRWIGLSTDTKPSSAPVGSTFLETDSGVTYVYDGSAWQQADQKVQRVRKTLTFTGAANLGAVGAVPLFTVTGEVVIVYIIPFCTTLLGEAAPGSATLALGVTGNTTLLIAATTALDIDANEFWVDTAPDANGVAVPAALRDIVITDNVIMTVAAAAINSGVIRVDCYWIPLSADASVVAV